MGNLDLKKSSHFRRDSESYVHFMRLISSLVHSYVQGPFLRASNMASR